MIFQYDQLIIFHIDTKCKLPNYFFIAIQIFFEKASLANPNSSVC